MRRQIYNKKMNSANFFSRIHLLLLLIFAYFAELRFDNIDKFLYFNKLLLSAYHIL